MEKGYHKGQDLTMSELGLSLEELAGQPLELFAREGAKLLLMVGMEEEVTTVLMRRPYERSQGKVIGYRNGHRDRQVSCGAGVIEVPVPPPGLRYRRDLSLPVARSLAAPQQAPGRNNPSALRRGAIDKGLQAGTQAIMGEERTVPLQCFTGKQSPQGSLQQLAPPRPITRRYYLPLSGWHLPGGKRS